MNAKAISNGAQCATGDYLRECADMERENARLDEAFQLAERVAAARRVIPREQSRDGSFYDVAELTLAEIRTVMRVCGHRAVTITADGVEYV